MENNLRSENDHAFQKRNPSGICNYQRRWHPNVKKQHFFSDILDKKLTLEVTTKAKKCINRYGGFDNYILLTRSS